MQEDKSQETGRFNLPECILILIVLVLGSKHEMQKCWNQDSESQETGLFNIPECVLILAVLVLGSKFENILMYENR